MATTGTTYLSLADVFKRQEKNDIADVIELLSDNNEMLQDMVAVECNDGTTHLTTMRTGLPSVTWRKLYQGVQPSKSTTRQVRDSVGMAEARSVIDKKLVDLSPNPKKLRLTEGTAFLEALNMEIQEKLIYGSTFQSPEQFTGFMPRFNSMSAENGTQIIDAGGTGNDNTSILFVVWGERTCHALYPKGSKAGIERDDRGRVDAYDEKGGKYDAMEEVFKWDIGLSVRDWRYVARIANIDVNEMRAGKVDLYKLMTSAYYRLHQRKVIGGKAAIYCNVDVLEMLDQLATNKGASDNFIRLRSEEVEGKEIKMYRGIPVRQVDAILNTEARVV